MGPIALQEFLQQVRAGCQRARLALSSLGAYVFSAVASAIPNAIPNAVPDTVGVGFPGSVAVLVQRRLL